MIVEPVLGEGGYVVPPVVVAGRACGSAATTHGILLIFDEVQCGIGRTGQPFAAETFGVTPDVILFAKGVASGLPLGGIIAPQADHGPLADRRPRLHLRREPRRRAPPPWPPSTCSTRRAATSGPAGSGGVAVERLAAAPARSRCAASGS